MKNTLGKVLVLFILLFYTNATAQSNSLATFNLSTNNSTPYIKEAVEITFEAKQIDHENVMFFFLTPKPSDKYKIILLNKKTDDIAYHNKKTTFKYLLFGLVAQDIKVEFDFTIKVASDEAVAQVYRGSRDNVKWIETINTKVDIKPLVLDIKPLKQTVDLVGDFKIDSKLKSDKISAYDNVNITYYLDGIGYNEFSIEPIKDIEDINIFSDITKHFSKATKDGYKIKQEYNYALVAKKDFVINSKTIKCYSPKKDKYYTLKTKQYTIKVDKIQSDKLVDKKEYPLQNNNTNIFNDIKEYLLYIFIFFIGYISAKIELDFNIKNNKKETNKAQYNDIKKSKTAKELLHLLISKYNYTKDEIFFKELEDMVYNKKSKYNFSKIKKKILEQKQDRKK
jgi:hypothetical protein